VRARFLLVGTNTCASDIGRAGSVEFDDLRARKVRRVFFTEIPLGKISGPFGLSTCNTNHHLAQSVTRPSLSHINMSNKAAKTSELSSPAGEAQPRAIVPMRFPRDQHGGDLIDLSGSLRAQVVVPQSLEKAVRIATRIVESRRFLECLETIQIIDDTQQQEATRAIASAQFSVNLIYLRKDMDAYALVYRTFSSNIVYLNPLMLMKIARKEYEMASDAAQLKAFVGMSSRFLAGRLVHELIHHFNGHLNAYFRTHPSATISPRKNMTLRGTKQDMTEFGDAAEMDLFGYIAETRAKVKADVFCLDEVVLYRDSMDKANNNGFYADAASHIDLEDLDIENKPGVLDYIASTRPCTTATSRMMTLPSRTSCTDERDIADADSDDEDEDDSGLGVARK
jgi:hypothetical protein